MDRITLKEACVLLGVSRPTLNVYRKKYGLTETRFGGQTRLSKTEIIEKILLPSVDVQQAHALTLFTNTALKEIQPLPGVYDLRKIEMIDAYGVMSLLCGIKSHLRSNESHSVHLILDGSPLCSYLDSIGFFIEVERAHRSRVFCNYSLLKKRPQNRLAIILPLHLIGYRGAEKKILDELYNPLLRQGFSENYCSHIGWVIGEICDNAHTHSEGPCYLIIEGLEQDSTATRHLSIAIGDMGIGIPSSLKKNPKYSANRDEVLLPLAFQSEVSRMEVEPKRGKGLNDVMAISKGNSSLFKVESGGLSLVADFRNGVEKITFTTPTLEAPGTRFSFVLIDSEFKEISRTTINQIMDSFMESI